LHEKKKDMMRSCKKIKIDKEGFIRVC